MNDDILMEKRFLSGEIGYVMPLIFGRARIGIGDETGFSDIW